MTWAIGLALMLALALIGLIGLRWLAGFGRSRWTTSTQALIGKLEATRRRRRTPRYDARDLVGLPAPVQRYFRAVLSDGQRIVSAATVELTGSFNLSQTGERWKPFTSMQRVVTSRPGFAWDGQIELAPGIAVHVHDAYIAGVGSVTPSVMGLYDLANVHGEGEIARGELMRYFAEAAWYPTALLPSQGVRWTAIDDHSANATLTDGALSVTMRVTFDDEGLIASARFDARGAMVGKQIVPTPWEGRWSDYQQRHGMRVPMKGEAAWWPAHGRKPYFRGTVTALAYDVSP